MQSGEHLLRLHFAKKRIDELLIIFFYRAKTKRLQESELERLRFASAPLMPRPFGIPPSLLPGALNGFPHFPPVSLASLSQSLANSGQRL